MKYIYCLLYILSSSLLVSAQKGSKSIFVKKDTSKSIYLGFRVSRISLTNNTGNTVLMEEFHRSLTNEPFPEVDRISSSGYSLETNIFKQMSSGVQLWSGIGFLDLNETYFLAGFGEKGEYFFASSNQKFSYYSINLGYDFFKRINNQNKLEIVPYIGFGFRALLQRQINGFVFYKAGTEYQWENISLTRLEPTYHFDKIYLEPALGIDIEMSRILLGFKFQFFEKDYFEQTIPPSKMRRDSDKNFAAQISFGFKL